jgi:hypothetical protein
MAEELTHLLTHHTQDMVIALLDPKILDPKITNRKQRKSWEIESNMYGKGVLLRETRKGPVDELMENG